MIDYSGLPHAKPKPRGLEKVKLRALLAKQDREESAKARARSEGRCEVREGKPMVFVRCQKAATQTHHLIGGIGRRNKGKSVLAQWKLRVCERCHEEITRHILQPTTAHADASAIRYRRVR